MGAAAGRTCAHTRTRGKLTHTRNTGKGPCSEAAAYALPMAWHGSACRRGEAPLRCLAAAHVPALPTWHVACCQSDTLLVSPGQEERRAAQRAPGSPLLHPVPCSPPAAASAAAAAASAANIQARSSSSNPAESVSQQWLDVHSHACRQRLLASSNDMQCWHWLLPSEPLARAAWPPCRVTPRCAQQH